MTTLTNFHSAFVQQLLTTLSAALFLLLSACNQSLPPAEYVRHVKDPANGCRKEKTIGPVHFDLQYNPTPYLIANQLRSNTISVSQFENQATQLEGVYQFNLKLSVGDSPSNNVTNYGVSNETEQQQRLHYLAFGIQHDIRLVVGRDTLKPSLFHFERSFDAGPHRSFVLAFPRKEIHSKEDKILIVDAPILNTGRVKFRFKAEDLETLPEMKLMACD